jgi:DNA-directed RNA polymerase subunit M/transcription elongation factor TFIIS
MWYEEFVKEALDKKYGNDRLTRDWRYKYQQVMYNLQINNDYLLTEHRFDELVELNNEALQKNQADVKYQDWQNKMRDYNDLLKVTYGDESNKTIQCRKCKENSKVEWRGVQTRSADEGMTIFCHCLGCGRRWKESG